jgi:hypothetical protein
MVSSWTEFTITKSASWPILSALDDRWWLWSNQGNEWIARETEILGENLLQCHSVHRKYQMTWVGLQLRPPLLEAGHNRLSYGAAKQVPKRRISKTNFLPTASENRTLRTKTYTKPWRICHVIVIPLSQQLLSSWGESRRKVSGLGRLIGLIEHTILADSFYFVYVLLRSIWKILIPS